MVDNATTENSTFQNLYDNSDLILWLSISDKLNTAFRGVGIITNTLCIIVFIRILRRENSNNQMFRYLLLKTIIDLIYLICNIIYCDNCKINNSLFMNIWYVWFYWYLGTVNQCISSFLEIAATFNCLISIKNNLKYLNTKKSFYIISIFIFVFNFISSSYIVLSFRIVRINGTLSQFTTKNTDFFHSLTFIYLQYTTTVIRDLGPMIILVTLNTLILIQLRQVSQRRKSILKTLNTVSNRLMRNAEANKTLMILFIGLNYIILHSPWMIYQLPIYTKTFFTQYYLSNGSVFCYNLSFALPFFFYFAFNKTFRKYSNFRI
jgi:hypothetical protein